MKTILLALILAVSAHAKPSLDNIVLGIDYLAYEDESPYLFPCTAESDVMFCDEFVRIEDTACTETLKITITDTEKTISCILASGEDVMIAQTPANAKLREDSTQPAGYYHLNISKRVSLKKEGAISTLVIK